MSVSSPGPVPVEALEYFRAKGLAPAFSYKDVWREEHASAFTVAKAMEADLLGEIRAEVDRALAEGRTFRDFAGDLAPRLQERGWWGVQEMTDPLTGKTRMVQLGSPRRLKIIYSTNLRTARAAGQWERIQRTRKSLPFLLYQLGPSQEHRPEHMGWHGLLLPVDDPWWETHMPPNGWGCKCRVRQVSGREAERLGASGVPAPQPMQELDPDTGLPTGRLKSSSVPVRRQAPPIRRREWINKRTGEVHQVPEGIDPGWDYNPGRDRVGHAARLLADKYQSAPANVVARIAATLPSEIVSAMTREYQSWAAGIRAGKVAGAGGRRVVGAMSPTVLDGLARLGIRPATAALSIEQREITHLLAEARKGAKALPEAVVLSLPDHLATAKAVVWDGAGRKPALLYVLDLPGLGKMGRVVVRVDYKAKQTLTNAVRSGGIVERANLGQPGMVLLEGDL